MDTEDEIPIHPDTDNPLFDEMNDDNILEEDVGQVQVQGQEQEVEIPGVSGNEEYGSYNELPEDGEEIQSAYDIGDTLILLLKSKDAPFLGNITEILPTENLLKIVDEDDREFLFLFENGEILMNTDSYEIIDLIKVRIYDPVTDGKDDNEYKEIDFDSEIMLDKNYSDLAKKDDLLSSLIHSMNIYDNSYKIKQVQETLDIILEMINYKEESIHSIPHFMIPIVDDNLKAYDSIGLKLEMELTDEINNLTNITSYKEYINNNIKYSKPIETTNGYGLVTEEYSNTYLRNCLQDDTCFSINGSYTYDERKNNELIKCSEENIVLPNRLRFVGLLEEPFNEFVYSVNYSTMNKFSVFEKYIYEYE